LKDFSGKRYHTFNVHLKETFGTKVYKIAVDAGFSCPNRNGTLGTGGCIYCNEAGSGAAYIQRKLPLEDQITRGMSLIGKRYKASKFIVYFQPFSNTYAPVTHLKEVYDRAFLFENVVGISIGTRPDCLNEDILDLLHEYSKKTYLWLEIGLQSIHDKTLELINRGHNYRDFINMYNLTRKRNLRTCLHVIIGLPGETEDDILATSREVARLNPEGIKIHSLYVEKNTALEKLYREKPFKIFNRDEYVKILIDFLEELPSEMVIQRVLGESNREHLIAPDWILQKASVLKQIDNEFLKRNSWQGKNVRHF